ncbi:alginate lyase family protein [Streptomyces fumanus]|uniref:alginate lyase family protein n=1 Tax=Streptomyces fumanus TaxID=67302 RepID=UPI00167CC2A6|nr:alginate lyase family protein [Streptomyces fumanus]
MRAVGGRVAALVAASLVAGTVAACGQETGHRASVRALPADAEFTHPGVLVSEAQLDTVRKNTTAGRQPWLSAYLTMRDSAYGSYRYRARPFRTVSCPAGAAAGRGCAEERADAIAAYTQALLFAVTGKRQHAAKARGIMDAWSARLTRHTGENAGLQAGWTASSWARAAELIRHTPGGGWPKERVRRFEKMLRTAHLPKVTRKAPDFNGNWDLITTDGAISAAVFLDDRKTFNDALQRFRERVPAYFYLEKDGRLPLTPAGSSIDTPKRLTAYWFRQTTYKDGVTQETCRNFAHVGYSIAATAHIAETAWHQGVDLYGDGVEERLRAALELHAAQQMSPGPAPRWLCAGKVERNLGPDLEVALNHLENRRGLSVPAAHRLAAATRPAGTDDLFVSWETLTHAGNPGR